MMFLLIGENRKGPAGVALTDADRALLFNSLVAQSGTYKVEGTKVLIHYDGSATPSLTGAERAYSAEISGNDGNLETLGGECGTQSARHSFSVAEVAHIFILCLNETGAPGLALLTRSFGQRV